jgi:hypothetical protein
MTYRSSIGGGCSGSLRFESNGNVGARRIMSDGKETCFLTAYHFRLVNLRDACSSSGCNHRLARCSPTGHRSVGYMEHTPLGMLIDLYSKAWSLQVWFSFRRTHANTVHNSRARDLAIRLHGAQCRGIPCTCAAVNRFD